MFLFVFCIFTDIHPGSWSGMETREASRAEQGARAAMAEQGIQDAMAGPSPRPWPLRLEPYYPPKQSAAGLSELN